MRSTVEKSETALCSSETAIAPDSSTQLRLWQRVGVRCRRWIAGSRPTTESFATVLPFWDRDAAFMLGLAALRQNELALAERELTRGDGDNAVNDARCVNLLGVIHECRGYRGRARACYRRAARLDRSFAAPRTNLRRDYELTSIGNTRLLVALGDEVGLRS